MSMFNNSLQEISKLLPFTQKESQQENNLPRRDFVKYIGSSLVSIQFLPVLNVLAADHASKNVDVQKRILGKLREEGFILLANARSNEEYEKTRLPNIIFLMDELEGNITSEEKINEIKEIRGRIQLDLDFHQNSNPVFVQFMSETLSTIAGLLEELALLIKSSSQKNSTSSPIPEKKLEDLRLSQEVDHLLEWGPIRGHKEFIRKINYLMYFVKELDNANTVSKKNFTKSLIRTKITGLKDYSLKPDFMIKYGDKIILHKRLTDISRILDDY